MSQIIKNPENQLLLDLIKNKTNFSLKNKHTRFDYCATSTGYRAVSTLQNNLSFQSKETFSVETLSNWVINSPDKLKYEITPEK